ncbi:CHAP domain-containing protein [Nonomuraea sp. NPDC050643]|uniref:CHAP domain-containing protein n=1 Tax=Nonomuraea sp. NPDC050643 TaxID=3155660 RepID=UPI0033CEAF9A
MALNSGDSLTRTLSRTTALAITVGLALSLTGPSAMAGTAGHSARTTAPVEDDGPADGVGTDVVDESDVSVAAAQTCQCVTFVKRYYGLTGGMANATDMGPVLKRNGFRYVGHGIAPRKGDVAVWKSNYYRPHGHIAIVNSAKWDSPGWVVKFRGANQSGSLFTQKNCKNVSIRGNMGYTAAYYYRR